MFQAAKTDNIVFKLYYRYTVLILLLFSFVITCRLFAGSSVVCLDHSDRGSMASSYCYSSGTFTLPAVFPKNIIYPGIAGRSSPQENRKHVPYYQWVNLFFLVLAILFYLPHLIWKIFEGGLVAKLTAKVNDSCISETERKAAIVEIAKYIITTHGGHLLYTVVYILSEVLNWLIGVLLTVWLLYFFNVDMYFRSDESEILTWSDFFSYNFPLRGKCEYRTHGISGIPQRYTTSCHLPLNYLYGFMFLFLYAWFILLCILQATVIPYRLVVVIVPPIRLLLFRLRSGLTDHTLLSTINSMFSRGDWFLLTRLQKNLLSHDVAKLLTYIRNNFSKTHLDLEMDDLSKLV